MITAEGGKEAYKLIVGQGHTEGYQELKKMTSFQSKPINFDINYWITELGIKNFDGVFSKNNVKNKKKCGIINLDYPHGPGTHWICYINNMYFHLNYRRLKISVLLKGLIICNIKILNQYFVATIVCVLLRNINTGIHFMIFYINV